MPNVTFFPLGNADCCRIELNGGERILFDYANTRCADDKHDKRADLPALLREDLQLAKRDFFDVVAFTHLDMDHFCGASEFFELWHAKHYQGGDRIKMNTMWVPASAICEDRGDLAEEGRIIQAEARHRLKEGNGIRVFSRPAALEKWLEGQGLTLESRAGLITDAGKLAPEFTLEKHGVEFFVHSPFASRHDDGTFTDRNSCSLVMQVVFEVLGINTKFILAADTIYEVWEEIVRISRLHSNEARLESDIFKLPHHCSYRSLANDKGNDKTIPVPDVQWIFEAQGQRGNTIVSASDPIPATGDDGPPHRQAANYYKECQESHRGSFIVTMEHPSTAKPEPLVLTIDHRKVTVRKRPLAAAAATSITTVTPPRAGV